MKGMVTNMVHKIEQNNMQAALKAKVAVVDFSATWCGPCMRQAPILEELAGEGYHIGKVDDDQAPDLAGTYRVMSIPTLILFKNGEAVKTSVGFVPKAQLESFVL